MQKVCFHSGAHSGATRYERDQDRLRLVMVCDRCGAERTEIGSLDYRPDPALPADLSQPVADRAQVDAA